VVAAEATAERAELPHGLERDHELAAFVAALLPETREDEIAALLAGTDIFTLARALRLRPPTGRISTLDQDAARYAFAWRQFETLHSTEGSSVDGVSFVRHACQSWLGVRHRSEAGLEILSSADDFDSWTSSESRGSTEFLIWPSNPFEHRLPALVAAASAVLRFKTTARQVLSVDPSDEFAIALNPQRDLLKVDADELKGELIAFYLAYRDACTTLARNLGLEASNELSLPFGEPKIHLWERASADVWVEVQWSYEHATVTGPTRTQIDGSAYPLQQLGDPVIRAKNELKSQVERALGSSLESSSSLRPELLTAWAW